MAYSHEYGLRLIALRKEANCQTTDEYLEWLERDRLDAREIYETAPPIRKTEGHQHEPSAAR
jgi:hypothetical protein